MLTCSRCGRENPPEAKFCLECGARLGAAPVAREQRKVVTVLFCDVVGSTALGESTDPVALHVLLARYFEHMKQAVERHGGTVEKFIGDAVMAVFGVPVAHEDDALRALRAAAEMRDALPGLGVQGRIGITTGEVVTGTEERLATGDAVNVAARLEQAAQPGEILIGSETLRLTRDAVEVESLGLLDLRGKAEPIAVHRLLSVPGDEGFARRLDAPMIGRDTELRRLRDAFDQATRDCSCQLFTILGPAGVGKSRLVAEFLSSLAGVAVVVRGRCLPYGEGITYWPVVEVLKQLPAAEIDPLATGTIRSLVRDEQLVSSSEEIAWAFRKQLEAVAAQRSLVCVFDDLHWGEETFLDLVEHVADLTRDAAIRLLCMARAELLDRRPAWAGGKVNATNVLLEPLARGEAERLIQSLAHLEETLRQRILAAAEGNPLFVEEMVVLVQESGGGVSVPPTIQALLAARLDQLDPSERGVLERGAVEGRVFHRGAVQALSPDEPQLGTRLTALVRKELVRPDRPQLPGEDAYRFRHLLIRDAAYDALPKATRAELHERFADWLEARGATLVELDEILGYHLERACRYRAELEVRDEGSTALAGRALQHLAAAGRRALGRGDARAGVILLERANALAERDSSDRSGLLLDLGVGLRQVGELTQGDATLRQAITAAEASGDRRVELRGRIEHLFLQIFTDPEGRTGQVRTDTERMIPELEHLHDDAGLSRAWRLVSMTHLMACRYGAMVGSLERALTYARRAGEAEESETIFWLGIASSLGPMPVAEARLRCLALLGDARDRSAAAAALHANLALLAAMAGEFEEARRQLAQGRTICEELGMHHQLHGLSMWDAMVELLADDPAAAERSVRTGYEALERMGEQSFRSTAAAFVAVSLCAQGRDDEALGFTDVSEQAAASDDVYSQVLLRTARARVLARRRDFEPAERLARQAVSLAAGADALHLHAEAAADLAEVLELAGKIGEAADALGQALDLCERKGNLVMAERTRARLAGLQAA